MRRRAAASLSLRATLRTCVLLRLPSPSGTRKRSKPIPTPRPLTTTPPNDSCVRCLQYDEQASGDMPHSHTSNCFRSGPTTKTARLLLYRYPPSHNTLHTSRKLLTLLPQTAHALIMFPQTVHTVPANCSHFPQAVHTSRKLLTLTSRKLFTLPANC